MSREASILHIVSQVNMTGYRYIQLLVDDLKNGAKIVKKECGNFSQEAFDRIDFHDIKMWESHEDACQLILIENRNVPICEVTIYDKISMPSILSYRLFIRVTKRFLKNISSELEEAFDKYVESAHKAHLETQRKLWMENEKIRLLDDLKHKYEDR